MRRSNHKSALHILLLALLFVAGCREEELPPPVTENPIFSMDLTWQDGASLSLSAGENRYYLFSGFEKDSLDVFEYSSRVAQLDCLDACEPSFAIYFRDDETTANGQPGIPVFLSTGLNYAFRHPVVMNFDTLISYRVQFQSEAPPFVDLFWDFGDSSVSNVPNPEIIRPNQDPFPVCLLAGNNPAQGCYSENCQTVHLDSTSGFSVTIQNDSNSLVLTAIPIGGQQPFMYQWDTGAFSQTIQAFFPGEQHCVTVTEGGSNRAASVCVQTPFPGTTMCVAGFTYQSHPETEVIIIPGDSLQFKSVILEYTDTGGVVFRSDRQAQPPNAYFVVDEVKAYEHNENGFPTLKVKARFSGILVGDNGTPKTVEEATVVFAVAYSE